MIQFVQSSRKLSRQGIGKEQRSCSQDVTPPQPSRKCFPIKNIKTEESLVSNKLLLIYIIQVSEIGPCTMPLFKRTKSVQLSLGV